MQSIYTQKPANWELKHTEMALDYDGYTIYKKTYQHPEHKTEAVNLIAKIADGVIVVPITHDNKIVLVQQYRFGCEQVLWELPGGGLDMNESIMQCGIRELAEETGYTGEDPVLLASCYPNPFYLTNQLHYIALKNCRSTQISNWDENEELLVMEVSIQDVRKMVDSGYICNSMTLTGLFYAHFNGLIVL